MDRRKSLLSPARGFRPLLLYLLVTMAGGFLVVQAESILGFYILPWFGGGLVVWTTTLLVFQGLFVGGAAVVHWGHRWRGSSQQGAIYLALLVLAAVALPITPTETLVTEPQADPRWTVVVLLITTAGLPCLALSAAALFLQRLCAISCPSFSAFRLYAAWNAGGLLALGIFAALTSRLIGRETQVWLWSGGYAGFVLLFGLVIWWARCEQGARKATTSTVNSRPPAATVANPLIRNSRGAMRRRCATWLTSTACASGFVFASAEQLKPEADANPTLWLAPLALFMFSLCVCFGSRWDGHQVRRLAPYVVGATAFSYAAGVVDIGRSGNLILLGAALVVACLALHGELVGTRPKSTEWSAFWLVSSTGWFLGAVLSGWVAPLVLSSSGQYALLSALVVVRLRPFRLAIRSGALGSMAPPRLRSGRRRLTTLALVGVVVASGISGTWREGRALVASERNFYGEVELRRHGSGDEEVLVATRNGGRPYGSQFLAPGRRADAGTYYSDHSGVALALRSFLRPITGRHFAVGVLGVGAGAVVAHAVENEDWSFYELDPTVARFAEEKFSFLADARTRGAHLDNVLVGDPRAVIELQLTSGGEMRFDVLVLDTLSDDTVPTRYLTVEAFATYWKVLDPNGVLAVNLSRVGPDLGLEVRKLAEAGGRGAYKVQSPADRASGAFESTWVLVTNNRQLLETPGVQTLISAWPANADSVAPWTDDSSHR